MKLWKNNRFIVKLCIMKNILKLYIALPLINLSGKYLRMDKNQWPQFYIQSIGYLGKVIREKSKLSLELSSIGNKSLTHWPLFHTAHIKKRFSEIFFSFAVKYQRMTFGRGERGFWQWDWTSNRGPKSASPNTSWVSPPNHCQVKRKKDWIGKKKNQDFNSHVWHNDEVIL